MHWNEFFLQNTKKGLRFSLHLSNFSIYPTFSPITVEKRISMFCNTF